MLYRQKEQNPILPIRDVLVDRNMVYANDKDIENTIRASFKHEDMLRVNPRKVAQELEKIGWVKSVVVRKRWMDKLEVSVEERMPILRWGDNGEYLDDEGVRFRLPDSPALKTLFLVSGPQGTEVRVMGMQRVLAPWFAARNIPFSSLRLDVHQIWHIETIEGIDIILGRENLNQRMKKFALVYSNIIEPYRQYIESVDLRYHEGFSVRWKNGVTPSEIANKVPEANSAPRSR